MTKHGKAGTKVYRSWEAMIRRCMRPASKHYKYYGGRGILVCKRWLRFEKFYADMGDPPTRLHTLDRINNDKGYTPKNCRWATRKQQARNTRTNRMLLFNGKEKPIQEWCRVRHIKISTVYARLQRGWSIRDALTVPVQDWGR